MAHQPIHLACFIATIFITTAQAEQASISYSNHTDAKRCYWHAQKVSRNPDAALLWSTTPCDEALKQSIPKKQKAILHVNRGIILVAQQDYQGAFSDYKKALEIRPKLAEAHINLGNLYFLGNKFDKALEFYNESLALGIKQDAAFYLNRGTVYENMERYPQAQEDYRLAQQIKPEWAAPAKRLAELNKKISTQAK